jgi:hypothetical protein
MEKALKEKLEKEGEQKVVKALTSSINGAGVYDPSTNVTANTFLNIVKEGTQEFEQKMGRPMTYSEMRDLYG